MKANLFSENFCDLNDIKLDKNNPRINQEFKKEKEQIIYLIENEDILKVAEEIIQQSNFFYFEKILLLKEKHLFKVIEGNRRIAALKVLQTPALSPEKYKSKFIELSSKAKKKNLFKNIPVLIFNKNNLKEADRYIARKHSGGFTKSWSRTNKINYIKSLINKNTSLEELSNQTGLSTNEISLMISSDDLWRIAKAIEFGDSISYKDASTKIPISTIQRLLPEMTPFLNLKFSELGKLKIKSTKKEFTKAYKKIISDIISKKTDSRKLNTSEERRLYFESLSSYKPDPKKRSGNFTVESFQNTSQEQVKKVEKKKKKVRSNNRERIFLDNSEINIKDHKVFSFFKELKEIPIKKYPRISTIVIRSFFEITLKYYLRKEKVKIKDKEKLSNIIDKGIIHFNESDKQDEATSLKEIKKGYSDFLNFNIHSYKAPPDLNRLITLLGYFDNIWGHILNEK